MTKTLTLVGAGDEPRTPFDKALAGYTTHMRRRELSELSINHYRKTLTNIDRMLKRHGLADTIMDASTEALEQALDLHGKVIKGEHIKLSAPSRRQYRTIIVTFLEYALEEGYVPRNNGRKLVIPKTARRKPKPTKEADLKELLDCVGWLRPMRTYIILGSYAGLRRIEMATLRYEWVDFDAMTLFVKGKGKHERIVPMNKTIASELRTYFYKEGLKGPIFNVHPQTVGHTVASAMEAVGVDSSTHKLRHRFATRLYKKSKDLGVVAEALGHQSIETTRGYAQLDNDELRAAVDFDDDE